MKDNTQKTLQFYWQSVHNYKFIFWLTIILICSSNIIDAIIPVYFKRFFNELSSAQGQEIIIRNLFNILGIIAHKKCGI